MANRIPRIAILIFVFSFFLFLLGNDAHSVWDRDEPRYCQATREMLMTGDWVVPRFNGDLRYDKPILTYWLMAPSMMAFGINEFAARFPAAFLGAVRTVLLFFFAMAMGCSPRGALVAAAGSIGMGLLLIVSKAATTDSILIFTVTLGMYALWERLRKGFRWGWHVAFWATMGLSVLVKGPPGITFILLAWLAWHAWSRWRPDIRNDLDGSYFTQDLIRPEGAWWKRPLVGIGVFLLVALPWAVMVSIRTNGDFLAHSIGRHVVGRNFGEPTNNHTGPFFYYLLTLLPSLFPSTAIAVLAMIWSKSRLSSASVRFLWCWFVPGFIVVSLVSTKLPHYPAPLFPAICLLMGLWWTSAEQSLDAGMIRGEKWWRLAGAGFVLLVSLGLAGVFFVGLPKIGLTGSLLPFHAVAFVMVIASALGFYFWMKKSNGRAAIAWYGGWAVALVIAFAFAMPVLDAVRPSKPLAKWLHENAPADVRVIAVEYQEPSFVFYWGKGVIMAGRGVARADGPAIDPLRNPDRPGAMALLNDATVPTALVAPLSRWEKYQREFVADDGGTISPAIRLLHQESFYQFEKGRLIPMVIVGNFTPAARTSAP